MIEWWDWQPTAAMARRVLAERLRQEAAKVRADVVAAKLARARAWLNDAEALMSRPADVFVSDRSSRDLALFYLFLALQEFLARAAREAGV